MRSEALLAVSTSVKRGSKSHFANPERRLVVDMAGVSPRQPTLIATLDFGVSAGGTDDAGSTAVHLQVRSPNDGDARPEAPAVTELQSNFRHDGAAGSSLASAWQARERTRTVALTGMASVSFCVERRIWCAAESDLRRNGDAEGACICPICLDDIELPAQAIVTACSHVFHAKCCRLSESVSIRDRAQWDCPSCREAVTVAARLLLVTSSSCPRCALCVKVLHTSNSHTDSVTRAHPHPHPHVRSDARMVAHMQAVQCVYHNITLDGAPVPCADANDIQRIMQTNSLFGKTLRDITSHFVIGCRPRECDSNPRAQPATPALGHPALPLEGPTAQAVLGMPPDPTWSPTLAHQEGGWAPGALGEAPRAEGKPLGISFSEPLSAAAGADASEAGGGRTANVSHAPDLESGLDFLRDLDEYPPARLSQSSATRQSRDTVSSGGSRSTMLSSSSPAPASAHAALPVCFSSQDLLSILPPGCSKAGGEGWESTGGAGRGMSWAAEPGRQETTGLPEGWSPGLARVSIEACHLLQRPDVLAHLYTPPCAVRDSVLGGLQGACGVRACWKQREAGAARATCARSRSRKLPAPPRHVPALSNHLTSCHARTR